MLTGDMTAVKYEIIYCLSQSIMRSGLQDVIRRTVAKCEHTQAYMQLIIDNNWLHLFITECWTEGKLLSQWAKNLSHWVTSFRHQVTFCHPVVVLEDAPLQLRFDFDLLLFDRCSTPIRQQFDRATSNRWRTLRPHCAKEIRLFIYLFTIELNVHFFHTSTSIGRSQ